VIVVDFTPSRVHARFPCGCRATQSVTIAAHQVDGVGCRPANGRTALHLFHLPRLLRHPTPQTAYHDPGIGRRGGSSRRIAKRPLLLARFQLCAEFPLSPYQAAGGAREYWSDQIKSLEILNGPERAGRWNKIPFLEMGSFSTDSPYFSGTGDLCG